MNLNRQKISAFPGAQEFFAKLNSEKTNDHLKVLETRMRNGMEVSDLIGEIRFMERERLVRRTPFDNEADFVEFANKIHAYKSYLTVLQFTPIHAEE